MCAALLPWGVNRIAVDSYIVYHIIYIISYIIYKSYIILSYHVSSYHIYHISYQIIYHHIYRFIYHIVSYISYIMHHIYHISYHTNWWRNTRNALVQLPDRWTFRMSYWLEVNMTPAVRRSEARTVKAVCFVLMRYRFAVRRLACLFPGRIAIWSANIKTGTDISGSWFCVGPLLKVGGPRSKRRWG